MNASELIESLHAGRNVFGTLIVSPSPRWPEAIRNCGLDFVFIDTEHIALDRAQVSWMCQTYSALGIAPIVRIPSHDPNLATMALDGGAAGIIAPYVETADQTQALRGAVKLRPIKGQAPQGMLSGDTREAELEAYVKRGARERALIVNIESAPAIAALDEILAVPDLDGVLIGPHDLSCNLGIPEQYDRPEFLKACETIVSKARAAGIGAGVHYWGTAEEQARFLGMGVNMLIHSADITLFQKHLRLELAAVKKAAGLMEFSGRGAGSINI